MKKLKELVSQFLVPMRDKPKVFDGEIPWCRIEDIEGDYVHGSKSGKMVSKEIVNEMNLVIFPRNTVIVSCSARMGICAITTRPLITNQTFIGLVCGPELHPRYLLHYMNASKQRLEHMATGATVRYLSRKKFENFEINAPTLDDQIKITSIIDKAQKIRENKNLFLQSRDPLIQSLFYDFFGEPAKWDKTKLQTLDQLCDKVSQSNPADTFSTNFEYIDLSSIDGRIGKITESKIVPIAETPSRARQVLADGDVLISTVRPYLRGTALFQSKNSGVIGSTGLCVLRAKNSNFSRVIYALTRTEWFSNKLMSVSTGASYPAVKKGDVLSVSIPTITNEDAENFTKIFCELEKTFIESNSVGNALVNSVISDMVQ